MNPPTTTIDESICDILLSLFKLPQYLQVAKNIFQNILTEVGVGMVGWTNFGITRILFFVVGVIASVISYYICWVWLIRIHFQIINFYIYMVQFFKM
jgi:hypothetical protein